MCAKYRIKKDDEIIVIAGKDKGLRGKIKSVIPDKARVIVDGVNMVTRNIRANPAMGVTESRQIQIEKSIHISNVAIFNPITQKKDKVGFSRLENGKKIRVYRSSGEQIDAQFHKK